MKVELKYLRFANSNDAIFRTDRASDPGGGAFALFLRPHPGAFRQLMCPHPGEFAHFFKKMLMPGG